MHGLGSQTDDRGGKGGRGNEVISRAIARGKEGEGGTSNATEDGGEGRPAVQTPHVENLLNKNGCRSGISHCDQK